MKNQTKTTSYKTGQSLTAKVMLAIAGIFLLSTATTQAGLGVVDGTMSMDQAIGIKVINKADVKNPIMVVRGNFTSLFSDKQLTTATSGIAAVEVAPNTTIDNPAAFLAFTPDIRVKGTTFTYEVSIPFVVNEKLKWITICKINENTISTDASVPGIKIGALHTDVLGTSGIMIYIVITDEAYLPIKE